jgi:hypothetical protein
MLSHFSNFLGCLEVMRGMVNALLANLPYMLKSLWAKVLSTLKQLVVSLWPFELVAVMWQTFVDGTGLSEFDDQKDGEHLLKLISQQGLQNTYFLQIRQRMPCCLT